MTAINLKSLLIAAGMSALSASVFADLSTNKTVVNSANGNAIITVNFPAPVHGDLYLATVVNGEYLFFSNQGRTVSKTVAPFQSDSDFNSAINVLEVSSAGIPANTYPFYQVVTVAHSDPLNFNNWIGGLGGLHKLNFTIGVPNATAGDSNNDGFIDNDYDHDGYADTANIKCGSNINSRDRKHNDDDDDDDSNEKNDNHRHQSSSTAQVITGSNTPSSTCNPSINTPQVTTPFADVSSVSPAPTKVLSTPTSTATTSGSSTTNTLGQQLYNTNCKSCHSAASMKGRSASRISTAIGSVGPMRSLSGLSTSDIQAIAAYLVAP